MFAVIETPCRYPQKLIIIFFSEPHFFLPFFFFFARLNWRSTSASDGLHCFLRVLIYMEKYLLFTEEMTRYWFKNVSVRQQIRVTAKNGTAAYYFLPWSLIIFVIQVNVYLLSDFRHNIICPLLFVVYVAQTKKYY